MLRRLFAWESSTLEIWEEMFWGMNQQMKGKKRFISQVLERERSIDQIEKSYSRPNLCSDLDSLISLLTWAWSKSCCRTSDVSKNRSRKNERRGRKEKAVCWALNAESNKEDLQSRVEALGKEKAENVRVVNTDLQSKQIGNSDMRNQPWKGKKRMSYLELNVSSTTPATPWSPIALLILLIRILFVPIRTIAPSMNEVVTKVPLQKDSHRVPRSDSTSFHGANETGYENEKIRGWKVQASSKKWHLSRKKIGCYLTFPKRWWRRDSHRVLQVGIL